MTAAPPSLATPAGRQEISPRRFALLLSGGLHFDDGTMRGYRRVLADVQSAPAEFSNESKLYGALGFMAGIGARLRLGGLLRYYGEYDYQTEGGGEEVTELGRLAELVALVDWRLPITARIDALLGGTAGFALLFPGGDLEEEIRRDRASGASVWDVPRAGYLVGPQVSGRYWIFDRLAVRADLGVEWAQTFLFFTKDEIGSFPYEKVRRANVVRTRFSLSLEVAL